MKNKIKKIINIFIFISVLNVINIKAMEKQNNIETQNNKFENTDEKLKKYMLKKYMRENNISLNDIQNIITNKKIKTAQQYEKYRKFLEFINQNNISLSTIISENKPIGTQSLELTDKNNEINTINKKDTSNLTDEEKKLEQAIQRLEKIKIKIKPRNKKFEKIDIKKELLYTEEIESFIKEIEKSEEIMRNIFKERKENTIENVEKMIQKHKELKQLIEDSKKIIYTRGEKLYNINHEKENENIGDLIISIDKISAKNDQIIYSLKDLLEMLNKTTTDKN